MSATSGIHAFTMRVADCAGLQAAQQFTSPIGH
jgi:hypothetical protein